jgi:type I restriction enzyme S subunit
MSEWQLTKLKKCIRVKHGFPFKSEFFAETGDFVVLTPGNFYEEGGFKRNEGKDKCYTQSFPEEYLLKKDDLVVAMTEQAEGLLGSAALVPENGKFLHNQRLGLLTAIDPGLDLGFVYHLFKTKTVRTQIRLSASGSKVKHTSPDRIGDVEVRLPPKDIQGKIAKVLSTLDAKITLNRRLNAELEAMAKLLYDYWFVQFDFPISAAQATAMGRPDLEGKPYRASGGKMVYNKELKREIPEGWEVRAIADYCSLNAATWTIKSRPDVIHYVDLANTKAGRINEITSLKKEIAPSRAQRILRPGDTIIGTVRPENGSYACVPKSNEILTGSTGFAVLTPKSPSFREFNYLGLTSRLNITRLSVIASGAAYPAVNPEVVAALPIPSPPETLIDGFHAATSASFDLVETNNEQTQHLTQLRDWLLPMLMNGQVTVGDPVATQEG